MSTTKFIEEILNEFQEDQEWGPDTIIEILQDFIESQNTFKAEDFALFLQCWTSRENQETLKFEYCPACKSRSIASKGNSTNYSTEDGSSHISLQEFNCQDCDAVFWGL